MLFCASFGLFDAVATAWCLGGFVCSSRTMRAGSSVGKTATMVRSVTTESKEIAVSRIGCLGESQWCEDKHAMVCAGNTAW